MASVVGTQRTPRRRKAITMVGLVSLSLAAATTASAGRSAPTSTDSNEPRKMVVRYDDLNLSSETGAKSLLHRLERAARQVCDKPSEFYPLTRVTVDRACYAQSLERAIEAVGAQRLSAAYQSKYGMASRAPIVRVPG